MAVDMNGRTRVVARYPTRVRLYDRGAGGAMLLSGDSERIGIHALAAGETVERDLSCLESSVLRDLTPDGRIILVNIVGESGGPKGSIYWRLTDGSPMVRLNDGFAFGISPDGKWVTGYTSRESQQRKFVLMPTGPGEEIPVAIPKLPQQLGIVSGWLPGDGNYVVEGMSQSGKWQFFAWNRNTGAVRAISPEGIADETPLLSPDGRQMLIGNPPGWLICRTDSGDCRPVSGLSPHDTPRGWRQDNRSIYVTMHHDENRMFMVSVVDIETGSRTTWKEIHPAMPVDEVSRLKITPDGRAYAYNYSYSRSDLYLGENVR
jgi:hypothetical protein